MYIGIGTIVLIVIIVLVVLMLRRRLCYAAASARSICLRSKRPLWPGLYKTSSAGRIWRGGGIPSAPWCALVLPVNCQETTCPDHLRAYRSKTGSGSRGPAGRQVELPVPGRGGGSRCGRRIGRGRVRMRARCPSRRHSDLHVPSRYCLPDVLGGEAWPLFGGLAPGRGVCRYFTHLAISFCRALNIPARYVFGYLLDMDVPPDPAPMDFAARMEVWRPGRMMLDPSAGRARPLGLTLITR
jgi:hypothetical protein